MRKLNSPWLLWLFPLVHLLYTLACCAPSGDYGAGGVPGRDIYLWVPAGLLVVQLVLSIVTSALSQKWWATTANALLAMTVSLIVAFNEMFLVTGGYI